MIYKTHILVGFFKIINFETSEKRKFTTKMGLCLNPKTKSFVAEPLDVLKFKIMKSYH